MSKEVYEALADTFRKAHAEEMRDLVIVPEEAEIVRTVFRLYLEGYSAAKISEHLQEKGIRTTTGKEKWHATVVMKMLRNA